ncbi:MAG: hypothetical protein KF770_13425 [Anaerolineae bacterium]|nr:hypothetical protein [Anaerolineae bacterium]
MKKTNETLQTAVLLLLAAMLIVIFWQIVAPTLGGRPQLVVGDTSATAVPQQPISIQIVMPTAAPGMAAPATAVPGDTVVIVAPATWTAVPAPMATAVPAFRANCLPRQRCAP